MKKISRNVSLVLSSGGARGLTHIGAIDALLKRGYNITAVAGSSMGSIVGGMYASGNLERFREFMCSLSRFDIIRLSDLVVGKSGIIKGEKVFGTLRDFVGEVNIEDLPLPLAVVAADLVNHSEVVITEGDLLTAIRASSAIPSILTPVNLNDTLLVDGGVVNPLPIERVHLPKGNIVVAVNVNAPRNESYKPQKNTSDSAISKTRKLINAKWNSMTGGHPKRNKASGIFDIVTHSFELMQHQLTNYALQHQSPEILLNLPVNLADTFDFHRSKELIELGFTEMEKVLDGYEKNGK